jgi:hypothetical protein
MKKAAEENIKITSANQRIDTFGLSMFNNNPDNENLMESFFALVGCTTESNEAKLLSWIW